MNLQNKKRKRDEFDAGSSDVFGYSSHENNGKQSFKKIKQEPPQDNQVITISQQSRSGSIPAFIRGKAPVHQ